MKFFTSFFNLSDCYALIVKKILDINLMKKGAKKLLGTNDYSTFRSSSGQAKSPVRTIK